MASRSTSFLVPVAALATAVAVPTVIAIGAPSLAVPNPTSTVFINELHYDNDSTDAGEAIEIAGPAGTVLTGWTIELHNGEATSTTLYNTLGLGGVIPDQGGGYGTLAFTYLVNGIQNGPRDGIALVGPGRALVQFLSYEGALTANSGAAAGRTSTDIGVFEPSDSAVGASLQLTGTGTTYGNFTWSSPATASFGAVNAGQTFSTDTTTSSSTSSSTTTTTLPPGPCPVPPAITPISTIQGDTDVTPCAGRPVLIDGVVVGDYEGASPALRGFYLQEQDAQQDGDPATSEGIFVFNGNNHSVDLGDVVHVQGTVSEFQGQTQVSAQSITSVDDRATVTAAAAALPVPAAAHFERFEGMLTSFEQRLTVTEHFQLGRFGMVVVSGNGRLPQPTSVAEPGAPARAVAAANALNRLIVDDALQNQNPDPILFGRGGEPLTAATTLRGGDTVTGLVGVMTYTWAGNAASGNAYRVRPINDLSDTGLVPGGTVPRFTPDNPRPTAAPAVGGTLRIANFNVLNYFLTLDDGGEDCGPDGSKQECRGAETPLELERQRTKLLAALVKLDADIVGLIELENTTGVEPLADIVAGLNDLPGDDYAFIDTDTIGTDAIRVGIIYKPGVVSPIGDWAVIDESVDPRFDTSRNRPSLAQSFVESASGEVVTVVVNHLKSKNCGGETGGDVDDGDGHGCFNATRTAAAEALRDWVASRPTGIADDDVLLLGDMNSNAKEDPIDVFVTAGFVDLAARFGATYSFVFDGQWGSLDYALAAPTLAAQATGSADYHINSDEPSVLDYNTNFKSAGQLASLFAPDEFRTSDHDPVVSGFALDAVSIDHAVIVLRRGGGGTVALSGSVQGEFTSCPRFALRIDRVRIVDVATSRAGRSPLCLSVTSTGLVKFDLRSGAFMVVLALPASFNLADDTVEFGLEINGDANVTVRDGRRVGSAWIAD
jgi:uncharacterized protein